MDGFYLSLARGWHTRATGRQIFKVRRMQLMWIEGDTVVVESKDGRHESMSVGSGSAEEIAKQILIELDDEPSFAGRFSSRTAD
jgi:hypothetical protein